MDFGITKTSINTLVVSHNDNICFSYFAKCKTYSEFHVDSSVDITLPKLLYPMPFVFVPTQEKYRHSSTSYSSFIKM